MKVKVGTVLDSETFKKAKQYCANQDIPLNQLIEEAIQLYIQREGTDDLLTLEEALSGEPSSRAKEGSGRGEGDYPG